MGNHSGKAWVGTAFGLVLIGCGTTPPPSTTERTPASSAPAMTEKAKSAPSKAPEVLPSTKSAPESPAAITKPVPPAAPAKPLAATPIPPLSAPPPKEESPKVVVVPAKPVAPVTAAPTSTAPAKLPKDPRTFLVTAAPKDARHPFSGAGHNLGFLINGEPGKPLVVERGQTYTFQVDTGVQHDFYLTTSPIGWGSGTYSDGVQGQFTYQGEVTFAPASTTPENLYYQCRNHKYMGGKIHVVNKGEAGKVQLTAKEVVNETSSVVKVTDAQVKQKLAYGEMLLASSDPVKRVMASSHAEAKGLLGQSKTQFEQAKSLLAKNDLPAAQAAVDEGLRLMNTAARLVPAESVGADHKAQYETLHKEVKGYLVSYDKNVKAGQGKQASGTLDRAKFEALVKEGEALAAKGDYAAANKSLTHASTQITAVLSLMLDSATVVYDKSFTTPKEEYEYEVSRYDSFKELIPLALEQKQPTESQKQMMDDLVKKADRIVSEGKGFADRSDYTTAIQAYQAATENVERALKIIGVQ